MSSVPEDPNVAAVRSRTKAALHYLYAATCRYVAAHEGYQGWPDLEAALTDAETILGASAVDVVLPQAPSAHPLVPYYGDNRAEFWRRVHMLPRPRREALHAAGALLQEVEARVLGMLDDAEREVDELRKLSR